MLIQRLVEHAGTHGTSAPRYYRSRAVRWVILFDPAGSPSLVDRADSENKAGAQMPTPYLTRTSGVAAMLLADSMEYVLGVAKDESDKAQTGADRRNDAFISLLASWRDATGDPVAERLCGFFEKQQHLEITIPDEAKSSDVVAIMLDGEWAHLRTSATGFWAQVARERKSSGNDGMCLACFTEGPLLKTVPDMVKSSLIPVGVDSSGRPKRGRDAALISVNTTAQGRMGTLQLANTPICEDCGGQAMATLNALLADDRHRRRGDDNVIVWWLREESGFDPTIIDEPTLGDVLALLKEVHTAETGTIVEDNAFYALTLSANQSRVVVRDWMDVPIVEIKARLAAWFKDHCSADVWNDGPHYVPLKNMVRASGRWDKTRKQYVAGSAAHGLERDLLRTALRGAPPPPNLVTQVLHRIRNDHHIDLPRVAMLRLALTRPPYKENVMQGLDETATEPAYVWGRMFALLEAIQRRALPDVNATIRDRYFGLAMTQPAATMRLLRTNANGHLKKLIGKEQTRPAGRALDGRLANISQLIDRESGLPVHLDGRGQMQFILGYDQQRAADMAAARAAKAAKNSGDTPES